MTTSQMKIIVLMITLLLCSCVEQSPTPVPPIFQTATALGCQSPPCDTDEHMAQTNTALAQGTPFLNNSFASHTAFWQTVDATTPTVEVFASPIANLSYQVNAPAGLNVRACPSLNCPVIGTLQHRSFVLTIEGQVQLGDGITWVQIQTPVRGWVAQDYLSR